MANAARSAVLAQLRAADAPYVLVCNRHARHPCVSVDGLGAVTSLVARLHALGHRHILIAAYLAARQVMPRAPTAMVCSNDLLAIRCMPAAHEVGLRVPMDLSVAGFDGIGPAPTQTPAPTHSPPRKKAP